ncbi:MAG: MBL fold metallo-hydrolase [Candidatus Ventricola sp.]
MKLEWIGHACFRMTAQDGTVVITDPYDGSVGIRMLPLEADLVTMSHAHHDHCETGMLVGRPVIARGTEPAQAGSVTTRALCSYHDGAQGAQRGENHPRVFAIDGLKVVHMGDQGCMPSKEVLSAIADADVMLIPTGGYYTLDAQGARAVVEAVQPRCAVPMHVRTAHCGYPIAPVWDFLHAMGAQNVRPVREATILPGQVPSGVLLLEPLADGL